MKDRSPLFSLLFCRRCGQGYWTCSLDRLIFPHQLCVSCLITLTHEPKEDERRGLTPSESVSLEDRLAGARAFAPLHDSSIAGDVAGDPQ